MNSFLILLLLLVFAHLVTDFYLQPKSWVQDRIDNGYKSIKLIWHSLLHALVALVVVFSVSTKQWESLACLVLFVGGSHWIIDVSKVWIELKLSSDGASKYTKLVLFLADQFAHLLVLIYIALHASGINIDFNAIYDVITPKHIAIVVGYTLALKPTSIVIGFILENYGLASHHQRESESQNGQKDGLPSGGEMIGYLERILILTFLIKGEFAVIGFILTAKSILRFGELNNKKSHDLTEYVLLGSLLSVTATSIIGLSLHILLK